MAGKYEQSLTDQDFLNGVIGSASRLKMNMESIIEKYDRAFPDDDLIDLDSMKIVQNGNKGLGFVRKMKPHNFGATKLKYTKRKDALLKSLLNIRPSEFNPNVSMVTAREQTSTLPMNRNFPQEPSDAETLSSHDEDDLDDEDEEEEGDEEDEADEEGEDEDSMSASYGEEDDEDDAFTIDKDYKSLYSQSTEDALLTSQKLSDKKRQEEEEIDGLRREMGDELYDADEEDFRSDWERLRSGNSSHKSGENKSSSFSTATSTKISGDSNTNQSAFMRRSDSSRSDDASPKKMKGAARSSLHVISSAKNPNSSDINHSAFESANASPSKAIRSSKTLGNTDAHHSPSERRSDNLSKTFSHFTTSIEDDDEIVDDSFVSISSNRTLLTGGSSLNVTSTVSPTKANNSVNDTFLIAPYNEDTAERKLLQMNFNQTFTTRRTLLSGPPAYKRLSSRQIQTNSDVHDKTLISDRQECREDDFDNAGRMVQRQHSSSRTSGYDSDISVLPPNDISAESALNATYDVPYLHDTILVRPNESNSCKDMVGEEISDSCATMTINAKMHDEKCVTMPPTCYDDLSKFTNVPQKPLRFNPQKLEMARKRYKPPAVSGSWVRRQMDDGHQIKWNALIDGNEDTSSRVNNWVKGQVEAQGVSQSHFPSCPPKVPSIFGRCISPGLSCRQVGIDGLQDQREISDYTSQGSRVSRLSQTMRNSLCDCSHICQSPPTKLRKTDSFSRERSYCLRCRNVSFSEKRRGCHEGGLHVGTRPESCCPCCKNISVNENKCDYHDNGLHLETHSESSPQRYSFYYTGKCRLETSSIGRNLSASDDEATRLCVVDSPASPRNPKRMLPTTQSPCSEGKGSHFLLMNDEEFSQRVLQIVKNVKEYLRAESCMKAANINHNAMNNDNFTTLALTPKRQVSSASQRDTCMFPERYINMFSPSNPHRIDSDEVVSREQEEMTASLDFKRRLRSFRPRRNQNKQPCSQAPTKTTTVTTGEKSALPGQRDLSRVCEVQGHIPLDFNSEMSLFKKPLPTVPKKKPPLSSCTTVTQNCRSTEPEERIRSKTSVPKAFKPLNPPTTSHSCQGKKFREDMISKESNALESSNLNSFCKPLPFRASTPKAFVSSMLQRQSCSDILHSEAFEKRLLMSNEGLALNPVSAPIQWRSSTPMPYGATSHIGISPNVSVSTIRAPSSYGALDNVACDYSSSDVSSASEENDPDQDISLVE